MVRVRERDRGTVCVCERERKRDRGREDTARCFSKVGISSICMLCRGQQSGRRYADTHAKCKDNSGNMYHKTQQLRTPRPLVVSEPATSLQVLPPTFWSLLRLLTADVKLGTFLKKASASFAVFLMLLDLTSGRQQYLIVNDRWSVHKQRVNDNRDQHKK